MTNSADPEANWSGSTHFAKGRVYLGSAGQELNISKVMGKRRYQLNKFFLFPHKNTSNGTHKKQNTHNMFFVEK